MSQAKVKKMAHKLFNGILMVGLINYGFHSLAARVYINLKPIMSNLSILLLENKKLKMVHKYKYVINKIRQCIGDYKEQCHEKRH
jgi:hypothetical protein